MEGGRGISKMDWVLGEEKEGERWMRELEKERAGEWRMRMNEE